MGNDAKGVPFIWFGSLLLAFGLVLLIELPFLRRGRYYQIKMGALVDPLLIRSLAERYWKEEVPKEPCELDVKVDRGLAIELYLTLPHFPPNAALRTIERDLFRLLAAQLGLSKPFKVHPLFSAWRKNLHRVRMTGTLVGVDMIGRVGGSCVLRGVREAVRGKSCTDAAVDRVVQASFRSQKKASSQVRSMGGGILPYVPEPGSPDYQIWLDNLEKAVKEIAQSIKK